MVPVTTLETQTQTRTTVDLIERLIEEEEEGQFIGLANPGSLQSKKDKETLKFKSLCWFHT